jgi:hypothetical protein
MLAIKWTRAEFGASSRRPSCVTAPSFAMWRSAAGSSWLDRACLWVDSSMDPIENEAHWEDGVLLSGFCTEAGCGGYTE